MQRSAAIVTRARAAGHSALSFAQSKELAALYGIVVSDFWDVTDKKNLAHVAYPCVAKIDQDDVLHKTDRGGVILPIKNMAALDHAVDRLRKNFPHGRVIAQPLADIQQELIVGMKRDYVFGPVVLVGLGGIYTEIFKKTDLFVAPLEKKMIENMLFDGALHFLFDGARGQKPFDHTSIAFVACALGQIAEENSDIAAIDINPLLVYNNGSQTTAVDVKILLQ